MCKMMDFGKTRFVRGQVWVVEEDPDVTQKLRDDGSRVINGTRPYLVLKTNGDVTTCLPLTTNVINERQSQNDIFVSAVSNLGINDNDSRIVMSPTTKSNNHFIKYMYTFDEEAMNYITAAVSHFMFGTPMPKEEEEPVKEETIEDITPVKEEKMVAEKKVLPTCPYEQVEYHLTHRKGKEALFRNPAEARTWLEFWDGHNLKEIAQHYGIPTGSVSNWKTSARMVIERG